MSTYFLVTIFLPFTNLVDVEVDLKFPPPPPPPPPPNEPPNDELENDEKLKNQIGMLKYAQTTSMLIRDIPGMLPERD